MFSLKTHSELFGANEQQDEHHGSEWPLLLALATLAVVTLLGALSAKCLLNRFSKRPLCSG
jgi:Ca2+/H+ antiporter